MTIKGLKNQIKYAWQRLYRGYDDKVLDGWGLEDYFIQILPSLREFCKRELNYVIDWSLNKERNDILKTTILLIEDLEEENPYSSEYSNKRDDLFTYIVSKIGYYWS